MAGNAIGVSATFRTCPPALANQIVHPLLPVQRGVNNLNGCGPGSVARAESSNNGGAIFPYLPDAQTEQVETNLFCFSESADCECLFHLPRSRLRGRGERPPKEGRLDRVHAHVCLAVRIVARERNPGDGGEVAETIRRFVTHAQAFHKLF